MGGIDTFTTKIDAAWCGRLELRFMKLSRLARNLTTLALALAIAASSTLSTFALWVPDYITDDDDDTDSSSWYDDDYDDDDDYESYNPRRSRYADTRPSGQRPVYGQTARPAYGQSAQRPSFERRAQGATTSRPQTSASPRPEIVNTPPPIDPRRAGMRSVGVRPSDADTSAPQTQSAPVAGCAYAVGDRVEHPKFGQGVVERIEMLATDHKIVVAFSNYGSKTLLANFAKLTKL